MSGNKSIEGLEKVIGALESNLSVAYDAVSVGVKRTNEMMGMMNSMMESCLVNSLLLRPQVNYVFQNNNPPPLLGPLELCWGLEITNSSLFHVKGISLVNMSDNQAFIISDRQSEEIDVAPQEAKVIIVSGSLVVSSSVGVEFKLAATFPSPSTGKMLQTNSVQIFIPVYKIPHLAELSYSECWPATNLAPLSEAQDHILISPHCLRTLFGIPVVNAIVPNTRYTLRLVIEQVDITFVLTDLQLHNVAAKTSKLKLHIDISEDIEPALRNSILAQLSNEE